MSEKLKIEAKWLGRETGGTVERSFYADIGLAAGEDWLTLLEDLEARTVRNHLRGCAHRLAMWFAANWWRLRWEPETWDSRKDADWRIAHSMASAGGGYVWPNVFFASDGDSLAIASIPRIRESAHEPVRYLNRIRARITAAEFETKVDSFIEGVLSRMHSFEISDDPLPELWNEVLKERGDAGTTQWRKLEALCGYDPDEAPEVTIKALIDDQAGLGSSALEEVAAEGRHSTEEMLKPILELASSHHKPKFGGFRGTMPKLNVRQRYNANSRPWERGAQLARLARKEWNLGSSQPIDNKKLADLIDTKPEVFKKGDKGPAPMSILLRTEHSNSFDLYFNSSNGTSRRFAVGRLLGDHLCQANAGRLIPATKAKTSRQQFQRAFAQEFLCPFDALMDKLQTDKPDEDDISEAAAYFDVSPLMIKTTLVNKGELDREALM